MESILNLIEADLSVPKIPEEKDLATLSGLVKELRTLDARIEKGEALLEELRQQRSHISSELIPAIFTKIEMDSITTKESKISVEKKFYPSIKEENKRSVFQWLEANGHGSLVKKELGIKIKKGEKLPNNLLEEIAMQPWADTAEISEGIHHKTLEAFVNEQLKKGAKLPEGITVFEKTETKIKDKK